MHLLSVDCLSWNVIWKKMIIASSVHSLLIKYLSVQEFLFQRIPRLLTYLGFPFFLFINHRNKASADFSSKKHCSSFPWEIYTCFLNDELIKYEERSIKKLHERDLPAKTIMTPICMKSWGNDSRMVWIKLNGIVSDSSASNLKIRRNTVWIQSQCSTNLREEILDWFYYSCTLKG